MKTNLAKGKDITRTYALTDGVEVGTRRNMTQDEFERVQREAMEATDGNWWWCLARDQDPTWATDASGKCQRTN